MTVIYELKQINYSRLSIMLSVLWHALCASSTQSAYPKVHTSNFHHAHANAFECGEHKVPQAILIVSASCQLIKILTEAGKDIPVPMQSTHQICKQISQITYNCAYAGNLHTSR